MTDWSGFVVSGILVLIRVSGLMLFAPFFSSAALPRTVKAVFTVVLAGLLTPIAASHPGAVPALGLISMLGELSTGLLFGLSLTLLMEMLSFSGQLLGLQFSFSLVNVLDPNSPIETPLLSQLLNTVGLLVLLGAGLDRTLLSALMHTFAVVPVGTAWQATRTSLALLQMTGGVFLAAVQLSAPVMAATLLVEVVVALVGRMSPQLPVLFVGIPLKTLIGYVVLIGSLGVWPRFIEARFDGLLDQGMQLVLAAHRA
jgi:flagellar biosynthetic protein FliR